jgi:hypothetical protein
MKLLEQGRKFALSAVFIIQGLVLMGLSYILALNEKLTTEWVQLVTIWLPMAAAVTGAFAATNAYVSGKAIAAGQDPPSDTGAGGG